MKELVENSVDAAATCIGKQEVEKEVCVHVHKSSIYFLGPCMVTTFCRNR